jgi:hypothetical protein
LSEQRVRERFDAGAAIKRGTLLMPALHLSRRAPAARADLSSDKERL